jgi:toxin ParE1/3/4
LTPPLLRPAAAADIEEATEWYETRRPGLGRAFLDAAEAALRAVIANPKAFALVYSDRRRALLRRFPYSMVYRIIEGQIVVLAFIHTRRNPRVWKKRE